MHQPPPILPKQPPSLDRDSGELIEQKWWIAVAAVLLFLILLTLLILLLFMRSETPMGGGSDSGNTASENAADSKDNDEAANESDNREAKNEADTTSPDQVEADSDEADQETAERPEGTEPSDKLATDESGEQEGELSPISNSPETKENVEEESELPRLRSPDDDGPTLGLFSGGKAGFFGQEVVAERVAYVIDYSSSMQGRFDENQTRITRARNELMKSVDLLRGKQIFTVVLYNTVAYVEPQFVNAKATESNKRKLKLWLDQNYANGSTDPIPAMQEVLQGNYDVIFLVSDGEFLPDAPTRINQLNTNRIAIVTISLNTSCWTLKQIADDSGGQFVVIK